MGGYILEGLFSPFIQHMHVCFVSFYSALHEDNAMHVLTPFLCSFGSKLHRLLNLSEDLLILLVVNVMTDVFFTCMSCTVLHNTYL